MVEKIKSEITQKTKLPDDIKEQARKNIFTNIIIAIIAISYFIFLILESAGSTKNVRIVDFNIFSIIILGLAICLFEIAYKKDNGAIAMYGVEALTIALTTLFLPYVIFEVSEAHILLSGNNTIGADFLAQIQRRARKYNSGTLIITQQPSDFADPSVITQGKAIFDNASYYLVMGLKKQGAEDLSKLIDLNEQEKESIKKYNQGEALFVCGSRRMRVDVTVTEAELDSFGSGGGL